MEAEQTVVRLRVNGEERAVLAPTHHTLLEVLREECGLTGTKHGCELGECGTCTVLLDGRPVLSCLVLAAEAEGRAVETVEGLQQGNELHPLQAAFADLGAAQCGYCTPGILMVAKALLAGNPQPARPEIERALAGNLCRCTGYHKIFEAVEWAAARLRGEETGPPREVLYGAPLPLAETELVRAPGAGASPSPPAPPGRDPAACEKPGRGSGRVAGGDPIDALSSPPPPHRRAASSFGFGTAGGTEDRGGTERALRERGPDART